MEGARRPQATGPSIRPTVNQRRLENWLDSFLDYTEALGSPPIYCTWAGLAAIAGALERKVWNLTTKGKLYPNLYTIFVGPAGVGKTVAAAEGTALLFAELKDHHLGSSNVSRQSLMDEIRFAERRKIYPNQKVDDIVAFNSLMVISDELGVLLPAYENDFMNHLTAIYDCRPYSERKRGKDLYYKIDNPQLNLLAATTPSYLNALLPEGAWDQGFLARAILIYSGDASIKPLWGAESRNKKLFDDLVHDLKIIADLYGATTMTAEAEDAFTAWMMEGMNPKPDHPKLFGYSVRRPVHLLKLCIIASAAEGDDLTITLEHYRRAMDWLIEAEANMPDIFKSMRAGGDHRVIEDTWHHVLQIYMKDKKPIHEWRIAEFISERTPAHNVAKILNVMVQARILEEKIEPKIGKCYVPKPRRTIS